MAILIFNLYGINVNLVIKGTPVIQIMRHRGLKELKNSLCSCVTHAFNPSIQEKEECGSVDSRSVYRPRSKTAMFRQ